MQWTRRSLLGFRYPGIEADHEHDDEDEAEWGAIRLRRSQNYIYAVRRGTGSLVPCWNDVDGEYAKGKRIGATPYCDAVRTIVDRPEHRRMTVNECAVRGCPVVYEAMSSRRQSRKLACQNRHLGDELLNDMMIDRIGAELDAYGCSKRGYARRVRLRSRSDGARRPAGSAICMCAGPRGDGRA